MKIFVKNNSSVKNNFVVRNIQVKIIKEEKITKDCWNVSVHTFKLENSKVLYSLCVYKEISDAVKMCVTNPENYELYGNYYETSYYNLKCMQAQYVGTNVLISIAHKENIDRNEMIRVWASKKDLSESTVRSIIESCGWAFQIDEEKEFSNYKPDSETLKRVEIKFNLEPQKPTPQYIKLVDHIWYDEEKRIVIVFFMDGTKIVKKCHSEDKFDIYVGVSLAITKYLFGNNTTNFIKFVNRKKKKIPTKKGGK